MLLSPKVKINKSFRRSKQRGFLLLDVLSACALIALISLSAFTAHEHFNTSLKITKVRTAAEILAQDLRSLQRTAIFQCNEKIATIKPYLTSGYTIQHGTTLKKAINFKDVGCDGVYFSKSIKTERFSASGTPAYTGDYELRHTSLPNFSCTLSVQPVTGRVIINEGE